MDSPMPKYIINQPLEELGRGSFGVVYTAIDATDYTKVAVKKIEANKHHYILEQATEVYSLLKQIHENVVKIYDVAKQENNLYIFMEYCSQGDLNNYFETNKNVVFYRRMSIMFQIISGVEFLHKNRIIHRDIKPGNILIKSRSNGRPQIKLTDFDLSKYIDPEYETSMMTSNIGTARYKSPEFWMGNIDGRKQYHKDVDIYSTGLVFLCLLQESENKNGKLIPFLETHIEDEEKYNPPGQTIYERMKSMKKIKQYVPDYDICLEVVKQSGNETSQNIRSLIKKMTKAEPKERITAREVIIDLNEIMQEDFQRQYGSPDEVEKKLQSISFTSDLMGSSLVCDHLQKLIHSWDQLIESEYKENILLVCEMKRDPSALVDHIRQMFRDAVDEREEGDAVYVNELYNYLPGSPSLYEEVVKRLCDKESHTAYDRMNNLKEFALIPADAMKSLPALTTINLSRLDMTDQLFKQLLSQFRNLPNLDDLDLSCVPFNMDETHLWQVSHLIGLKKLNLSKNSLTDLLHHLIRDSKSLPLLQSINLSRTDVNGNDLACLRHLRGLSQINLSWNTLTGYLPQLIHSPSRPSFRLLEELHLTGSKVSGDDIAQLEQLVHRARKLALLSLNKNDLSEYEEGLGRVIQAALTHSPDQKLQLSINDTNLSPVFLRHWELQCENTSIQLLYN